MTPNRVGPGPIRVLGELLEGTRPVVIRSVSALLEQAGGPQEVGEALVVQGG